MKPITYFSMFSGIGGFEYGLQQSKHKFKNVGYSEIDKYARSIYEKNYPNHICFGDATEINTKDLPDFSILIGGFPCQTFSIAGKRAGFNDTRGTMFFELARILRDKQPTYFLFENVKGILSHEGGRTLNRILKILNELGYDVLWENYNSRDYNVPQNRERIYFKGYFRERCSGKVLLEQRNVQKNNARLISTNPKKQAFSNNKINITSCAENTNSTIANNLIKHFTPVNSTQNVTTNTEGDCFSITTKNRSKPLHKKETNYVLEEIRASTQRDGKRVSTKISPCLNSAMGCGGGHIPMLKFKNKDKKELQQYQIRRLTPVECERLQGFPDDYTKYGANGEIISDTQRYKCLGNAVTTTVVTSIANKMFEGVTR